MDVLPGKNVSPEKTSQRCAERRAERTVVDSQRHAVDGCPECSFGDDEPIISADRFPLLYNSAKKDGGPDICACELSETLQVSTSQIAFTLIVMKTYVTHDD